MWTRSRTRIWRLFMSGSAERFESARLNVYPALLAKPSGRPEWAPTDPCRLVTERRENRRPHTAEDLRERVLRRLEEVIDPEIGVDMIRMQLVEELTMDDAGLVSSEKSPELAARFLILEGHPVSNETQTLTNQSQTFS